MTKLQQLEPSRHIFSLFAACTLQVLLAAQVFAQSITASMSMGPHPSTTTVQLGDVFDVDIQVTNSSNQSAGGTPTPIAASLLGVTVDTTACQDSVCAVQLPGTFTFVPVGGNGCVANATGVQSCADAGDGSHVDINISPGSVLLQPNVLTILARIRLQFTGAPAVSQVFMRADTGPTPGANDLVACLNGDTPTPTPVVAVTPTPGPNLCTFASGGGSTSFTLTTPTPTDTPTNTPTATPTDTPGVPTPTPTDTPTDTPTPTPTDTPTPTPTDTPTPTPTNTPSASPTEICRGATWWAQHAGTESGPNSNVTQKVIDQAGGCMVVCGEKITNTRLNDAESAEEGLCVPTTGASTKQLARYLIAAALNCVSSGGPADCSASSIAATYAKCDAACAAGQTIAQDGTDCIAAGGYFLFHTSGYKNPPGTVIGVCANGDFCDPNFPCTDGSTCASPPAGSINKCNNANANSCAIVPCKNANGDSCGTANGKNEGNCGSGLKCASPETCGQTTCLLVPTIP